MRYLKHLCVLTTLLFVGCADGWNVDSTVAGDLDGDGVPDDPTPPLLGSLEVRPTTLDFGPVAPGCQHVLDLTLRNIGQTDVEVFGVGVAAGQTEFRVDPLALTLTPFESVVVPVAYVPADTQADAGELLVESDDHLEVVRRVPLIGSHSPGAEKLDTWLQTAGRPTDFVWVLDTSGSMSENIAQVVGNFSEFMYGIYEQGVDYQMGFVTMDVRYDQGYLLGSYGEEAKPWVTPEMGEEGIAQLTAAMTYEGDQSTGAGSSDSEQGLQSLAMALSPERLAGVHAGFIRPGARLVVVVLSDDQDYSPGDVPQYAGQLIEVKEGKADDITYHAIVALDQSDVDGCADAVGVQYLEMVQTFGGYADRVCYSDYSNIMSTIGTYEVGDLNTSFLLSSTPLLTYGIVVTVDNEPQQEGVAWNFDPYTNQVVFTRDHIPPGRSEVKAAYVDASYCDP